MSPAIAAASTEFARAALVGAPFAKSVVGRAAGVVVADSGLGFFERWVAAP